MKNVIDNQENYEKLGKIGKNCQKFIKFGKNWQNRQELATIGKKLGKLWRKKHWKNLKLTKTDRKPHMPSFYIGLYVFSIFFKHSLPKY